MRLIVRAEAEAELVEAIDWYEACDAGLGSDFLRCIDLCLERILRHPESYSVVQGGLVELTLVKAGDSRSAIRVHPRASQEDAEGRVGIDQFQERWRTMRLPEEKGTHSPVRMLSQL